MCVHCSPFSCLTVSAGGAVLHGIVQDLLQVFEAQTPPQNTQSQASNTYHTALGTEARPSTAWQGRAAAAVVALTEVLYGASPAWKPAQAQISSSPTTSDNSRRRHNGGRTCSTTAAGDEAVDDAGQEGSRDGEDAGRHGNEPAPDVRASVHGGRVLEQLVVQVLGDFSSADVWQVPTHVEPDASPGGTALTPQVRTVSTCLLYSVGSLLPVCVLQSHRILTYLANWLVKPDGVSIRSHLLDPGHQSRCSSLFGKCISLMYRQIHD